MVLQWIPGHCQIPRNESTDTLSKQGSSMPQTPQKRSLKRQGHTSKQQSGPGGQNNLHPSVHTTSTTIQTESSKPSPSGSEQGIRGSKNT
ncbi:hypothetical protein PoB_006513400 [Plakobranchus ocellatus]|uniref:Uncharacterized protein n=1 Tax=Plakobranchus ocellatus TaxID=259542 RepID=A0AAV4D3A8_9GAST|nr:hypothetical protein PoB_006513400 [Plakobranchus ocellatus]